MLMLLAPLAEYAEKHRGNLTIVMYVACGFFAIGGIHGLFLLRKTGDRHDSTTSLTLGP
jgi:hypothetical protein